MKDETQKAETNAEGRLDYQERNKVGKDRLDVWVLPGTVVKLKTLGLLNDKANLGETLDWVVEELSKQVDPSVFYRALGELQVMLAREAWGVPNLEIK